MSKVGYADGVTHTTCLTATIEVCSFETRQALSVSKPVQQEAQAIDE